MKQRSLLILSAIVMLFASCSNKGGTSGLMVPDDAAMVIHINSQSLASKLSWEEIKQTSWFKLFSSKEADSKNDSLMKQVMNDPAVTGVDLKSDILVFMKKQGKGSYMVISGSIKDAAAFEKFNMNISEKGSSVKKEDGFNYIDSDESGTVVWDKSRFAYVINSQLPTASSLTGMSKGYRGSSHGFSDDSLRVFGINALTLKGGDNLDKDSRFTALVKDGSDIHIWLNSSETYGGLSTEIPMLKTSVLFKDNVMAGSINFDNGKLTFKGKQYYGEEMNKILANYKAEPIKADIINRIPSSNILGVIAFNYSPEGIREIFKAMNLDAVADMFLAKANFSLDDLIKATKGEMILSVSDPNSVTKNDTVKIGNMPGHVYTSSKMDMNILFATSVNDKVAFEKLVTVIWDMAKQFGGKGRGGDDDQDGDQDMPKAFPGVHYKLEKDWFAVSNSDEFMGKFLAGSSTTKAAFADKITGHPLGMYVDLQKIIRLQESKKSPSSPYDLSTDIRKKTLDASINMWQDIVITGGEYKDKAILFDCEVNLVDKNTNSLKQLNAYIDKLASARAKMMEEMKKKYEGMEGLKDVPLQPPPASK